MHGIYAKKNTYVIQTEFSFKVISNCKAANYKQS